MLIGCDYFVGRILGWVESDGDHRGFILAPERATRLHTGLRQLGYQHVKSLKPGHAP